MTHASTPPRPFKSDPPAPATPADPAAPDTWQISSIRSSKGGRDRFRIEFAPEREPLLLSGTVLARTRLARHDFVSEARIAEILIEEERQRCLERAWLLLGRRKRGRRELVQTLKSRGFAAEMVESTVARLEEMGYIDDREFARFWVFDRMDRGRHGPERVRRELAAKGVARDLVEEALAPYRDDAESQRDRARALLERWSRTARQDDPRKRRAAATAYLFRRGFTADTIRQVVRETLDSHQSP